MARTLTLDRSQMLRALPKHLFWAAVLGTVAGPILYFLKDIELPGKWNLLMGVPIGAIYVNAAVLPIALPGRHWGFGFIASSMLFMLLIAGMIIAPKFPFAHAWAYHPDLPESLLVKVNSITWAGLLSGGCLGMFYGVLAGSVNSIVLGIALGALSGFFAGLQSLYVVVHQLTYNEHGVVRGKIDDWRFDSPLHFAWQLALMLVVLHLGACLGAAMGAGKAEGSKQTAAGNSPKQS